MLLLYVTGATIIVNLVSMGMSILGLVTMASVANMSSLTDDAVSYTEEELAAFDGVSNINVGLAVTYTLARMIFNALGIWGAYSYTVWCVGASVAVFGIEFVSALIVLHIPAAIYYACFAYPHMYLIMEMRNGIMTKETYPYEQHSCCCV